MGAKPLPAQTLARLRSLGQLFDAVVEEGESGLHMCKMCGSVLKDRAPQGSNAVRRSFKPHLVKPHSGAAAPAAALSVSAGGGGGQKRRLQIEFDQIHEDQLLNRIISLIEPGGLCFNLKYYAINYPHIVLFFSASIFLKTVLCFIFILFYW